MSRLRIGVITAFFFCSLCTWAQKDLDPIQEAVKGWVDTLCSPHFFGRGYEWNGSSKAGEFIQAQIQSFGLQPINGNWNQAYSLDVVEHAGPLSLRVNGKKMKLGVDYIPHPGSGNFEGGLTVEKINLKKWKDTPFWIRKLRQARKNNWAWLIRDSDFSKNEFQLKNTLNNEQVIFWEVPKLTGHIAANEFSFPSFYVLEGIMSNKDKVEIQSSGNKTTTTEKNIFGYKPGTGKEWILFTAHYDHIGGWGDSVFVPGANDNASGTALLLECARRCKDWDTTELNIGFVFFSGEEAGLKGSRYFVENLPIPKEEIFAVVNFDLVGTGEEGITVVNAKEEVELFTRIQAISAQDSLFSVVKERGQAANSDHYFFETIQVPAVFVYGMGPRKAYHDVTDLAETLEFSKAEAFYILARELCYGWNR